jgi:hypothetical protein
MSSGAWEIISYLLIPLKTPVSFRYTVPLSVFSRKNIDMFICTCMLYNFQIQEQEFRQYKHEVFFLSKPETKK